VNDSKPGYVVAQVAKAADQFKKPVIACLGLAFKADIDDLRESPALQIVQQLAADSTIGELIAVEPNIHTLPDSLAQKGVAHASLVDAIERANIVLVLVDHKVFKALDRGLLAAKVVIDTRGIV
jgi:UDP-N-acetyl-D-mannosaminuronic acid dehydrogenase